MTEQEKIEISRREWVAWDDKTDKKIAVLTKEGKEICMAMANVTVHVFAMFLRRE